MTGECVESTVMPFFTCAYNGYQALHNEPGYEARRALSSLMTVITSLYALSIQIILQIHTKIIQIKVLKCKWPIWGYRMFSRALSLYRPGPEGF